MKKTEIEVIIYRLIISYVHVHVHTSRMHAKIHAYRCTGTNTSNIHAASCCNRKSSAGFFLGLPFFDVCFAGVLVFFASFKCSDNFLFSSCLFSTDCI